MFLDLSSFINQYQLFLILAPLAAGLCLASVILSWPKRDVPGAFTLSVTLILISFWLLVNTLELISATEEAAKFWAQMQYPLILVPGLWLYFAFEISNPKKNVGLKNFWWIFIIPLINSIIVFTNDTHHLIWTSYYKEPGKLLPLSVEHGPYFYIQAFYQYVLVFVGCGKLIFGRTKTFRTNRGQAYWIVFGALQVILFNIIYVFGLIPALEKDYTPISFAIAGICFLIAITYFRMFDPIPVARNQLIDFLGDGLVLLDLDGNIIDANPSFKSLCGLKPGQMIGKSTYQDLLILEKIPIDEKMDVWDDELLLTAGENNKWFDVHLYPITLEDELIGKVLSLRDIDERIETEQALQESEIRHRQLFENCPLPILVFEMIFSDEGKVVDWIVRDINIPVKFLGYEKKEDIFGKSITELSLAYDLEKYFEASLKAYHENVSVRLEGAILSPDRFYLTSVFYFGRTKEGKELCATASVDITRQRRLQEVTEKLAVTDALTGAYNRRFFNQRVDEEISLSVKNSLPISFLMFDLDGFKQINDVYGHPVGDQVLKKSVEQINANIRSEDLLVRYGGDEFILMLPSVGKQHALQVASRIKDSISKAEIENADDLLITFSIGVLSYDTSPEDLRLETILEKVDQALYMSKKSGKGRITLL